MNRRGFLGALLGGTVGAGIAATLDPEKLLWLPGAKTIFIPKVQPVDPAYEYINHLRDAIRYQGRIINDLIPVTMDLNDWTIDREGAPGWELISRHDGYDLLVPKGGKYIASLADGYEW